MYEELNLRVHRFVDGLDLFQRQFSFQNQPAKSQTLQPAGFFRRSQGTLGRSMHDELVAHGQHGGILHNQGIHSGLFQGFHKLLSLGDFFRIQKRIDGGVDTLPKAVGILTEFGNIFHGIAGRLPGPEGRTGNINGIGPAVNGCEADVYGSGWSQ